MPIDPRTLPPEVLAVFCEEAREHLEEVAAELRQLESGASASAESELRSSVRRRLHNVKGAANSVGFGTVGRVAHAAEDVLEAVPADAEVGGETIDRLLMAVGWLVEALDRPGADATEVLGRLGVESEASAAPEVTAVGPAGKGGDSFVRIRTSALEKLLGPVASLATQRSEGRHSAERLDRVAEALVRLADQAGGEGLGADQTAELRDLARDLERQSRWLDESSRRSGLALADLEDQLRRMRLVPFNSLESALRLAVSDAAARTRKKVDLVIERGDVGLDRRRLDLLRAPLLHLLRNAVDHGIEKPSVRRKAKLPERGTVTIQLESGADQLVLTVEDDGIGIDLEAVRKRAVDRGLISSDEAGRLGDDEVRALLATAGFSTAAEVSELSGRGVGLDVVRRALENEGGTLRIEPGRQRGARFVLTLPAHLLTTRALFVQSGGEVYALPLAGVEGTVRLDPSRAYQLDSRPCIDALGEPALLLRLGGGNGHDAPPGLQPAVLVRLHDGRVAVVVDEILGDEEVVVRSLGPPYRRLTGVLGAAVAAAGRVVVVLNPAEIVELEPAVVPRAERHLPARQSSILVVDDSITTRTLERHVLESHGYLVRTASDGEEALQMLRESSVDLIVSDIQMPKLDGIAMLRRLRADAELADIPVVLVTSLASEDDERAGRAAGAEAYIVKSRFDQDELLTTIRDLLDAS